VESQNHIANYQQIELMTKLVEFPRGEFNHKGLFGKWRIQVDGGGLKGILGNFDL
jgi:hypothetical protein